ncbi:sigma-70, region 4 domain protein [Microscilla marina ATCC 23134]|uniref:Sigma-70, region 4 domain protein n=2 Tax=Microscilla marina TaxID=1027 RepID=A1ZZR5_MICM2|nr:sigma-70, region 4 domain protein [Microscilla marina ATCC 23134]
MFIDTPHQLIYSKTKTSPTKMKDQEIISSLRGGNSLQRNHATKALMKQNFASLCKIVLSYSKSPAETEQNATELFRDSFIALHRTIQNPQWSLQSSKLSTYFYTIAQRVQMNKAKKQQESPYHYGDISPRQEHKLSQDLYQQAVSKDENVDTLQQAIVKLDSKCQQLIKEYYYSNASWKDIAQEQKSAPDAIRQRASKCIKKLRSIYSTLKHPRND